MSDVTPGKPAESRSNLLRIAIAVIVIAAVVTLGRYGGQYLPAFTAWVNDLGPLAPILFILGYIVAVIAAMPAFILTLAAGAIFGLGLGVVYAFIAAVLGSSAAFLIARTLARSAVEKRIAGNPRFAAIDKAVGAEGRKIVFLMRLSPVFPFSLLNYALGLTKIPFIDYIIASVGMLPGTFLYVYYGKLAGDVAQLASGTAVQKDTGYYSVLALGLVATLIVTALVTRIARRALDEATATSD